jgi:hypothetical protein
MTFATRFAALAVIAAFAGAAQAQLPFPLPGQPQPDYSKRPQCTAEYVRSVEKEIAGLHKFRNLAPDAVGHVCSLIEWGSSWFSGGELSESTRKQLKDMLGFDIDLRLIRTQCRVGQGNLDRELMTRMGYLRSELVRCNDTI